MRNTNCQILSGDNSLASVTGGKVDSGQIVSASFQVILGDATAAGTFKLQASNDICAFGNVAADFTPTNWTDIPNQSVALTAATLTGLLTIASMNYRWIRAIYTRTTAGSTTAVVNMNALSI